MRFGQKLTFVRSPERCARMAGIGPMAERQIFGSSLHSNRSEARHADPAGTVPRAPFRFDVITVHKAWVDPDLQAIEHESIGLVAQVKRSQSGQFAWAEPQVFAKIFFHTALGINGRQ